MSFIDPRTVILLVGVMGGLMSLVMFFLRRNYPASIKGLGEWTLAIFLLFMAGVLASLRDKVPDLLAIALPNLLITSGTYLSIVGSQRFFGQPSQVVRHVVLIVLINLVFLWFTLVDPSYRSRTLILTLVLSYFFALHARLMLQQNHATFSSRFVGVLLCIAMLNELLCFYTTASLPNANDLFDHSVSNLVYITSYPFLMLLLSIGLVLLATERVHAELEHRATHDSLTNALTRRCLNEACQHEMERCVRHGRSMALLMIDLDHFKSVNDNFGHQTGDRVLINMIGKINALLRGPDQLGRFGGEEFVALLPDTAPEEAALVAERIRAACDLADPPPSCTVSIGLSTNQKDNDTMDAMIARADAAMYRAKALGRNRVELA